MILTTSEILTGLRALDDDERLEVLVRAVEDGACSPGEAADALVMAGGDPADVEFISFAYRKRLADTDDWLKGRYV
jgi:hypothetical protein